MATSVEAELVRAKRIVYLLLKFRSRSRKEIRDRLRRKKISTATIDKAIEHFERLGYINDKNFAVAWVTTKIAKPLGPRRIFFELKQKGVDEEVIQQSWRGIEKEYCEYDAALKVASVKMNTMKRLDRNTAKRRIYGLLNRRGFSRDVIQEVMEQL
ncbi:regulatory protein RecX [Candidatus Omnitrophota bacterium]